MSSSGSNPTGSSSTFQCFASASPIQIGALNDAGSPDAGPGTCGASNFTLACGTGHCPQNSSCVNGNACQCDPGFEELDCSGKACGSSCNSPNWWCVPTSSCSFETNYDPTGTSAEMIYSYNYGATFVALRLQPALVFQGTYQPVAWAGANPFVTPASGPSGSSGPVVGSLTMPVDWNNGKIGPGNVAIWVMVVHGSTVTNYVSRAGGAPIQITGGGITFTPGASNQGFTVEFADQQDDAGTDASTTQSGDAGVSASGADLEAVSPSGAPDPSEPVMISSRVSVRVTGANSSTAQCGPGGAVCVTFANCDPTGTKPDAGCGCDQFCGRIDPSTGTGTCCTVLGGGCSDSSECCGGNSCIDGTCQPANTRSLCGGDSGTVDATTSGAGGDGSSGPVCVQGPDSCGDNNATCGCGDPSLLNLSLMHVSSCPGFPCCISCSDSACLGVGGGAPSCICQSTAGMSCANASVGATTTCASQAAAVGGKVVSSCP